MCNFLFSSAWRGIVFAITACREHYSPLWQIKSHHLSLTVKTKRTTEKLGSKVYSKPPISVNPSNSSLPFKYSRGQYLIMSSHMIGVTFLPCKCLRMGFMWCANNSDLFRASLRQTGHVLRFHTWLKRKKKKKKRPIWKCSSFNSCYEKFPVLSFQIRLVTIIKCPQLATCNLPVSMQSPWNWVHSKSFVTLYAISRAKWPGIKISVCYFALLWHSMWIMEVLIVLYLDLI